MQGLALVVRPRNAPPKTSGFLSGLGLMIRDGVANIATKREMGLIWYRGNWAGADTRSSTTNTMSTNGSKALERANCNGLGEESPLFKRKGVAMAQVGDRLALR